MSGLEVTEQMRRSMMDGPQVGVGQSVLLENLECDDKVLECQCCHVRPGTGKVLVTYLGETSSILEECVMKVRNMMQFLSVAMARALELGDEGKLASLHKPGSDLHAHVMGSGVQILHTSYMAAMVLSMVSLLVGRRPANDLGAVGEVQDKGMIDATFHWTAKEVWACYRQGLRRMVVPLNQPFDDESLALAGRIMEDGRPMVEFLRFDSILEALSTAFGRGVGSSGGEASDAGSS